MGEIYILLCEVDHFFDHEKNCGPRHSLGNQQPKGNLSNVKRYLPANIRNVTNASCVPKLLRSTVVTLIT